MSCLETFATLRVFSESMSPNAIGDTLGLKATDSKPRDAGSPYWPRRDTNTWFWSTQGKVQSNDNLEHVGAVIELFSGKRTELKTLRDAGCKIDISSYYVSSGQGGPELDLSTMKALCELELEIWWDIYFGEENET